MKQTITQVDAFTDRPFRGNPAAVCVLEAVRDEGWMQDVAREMNLAETAFLHPEADGWRLRWFTPTVEVELCGHATLASAHVLWESGRLKRGKPARFYTLSGALGAKWADGWIELDFPATPAEPSPPPPGLLAALGLGGAVAVARSRFDYLVEVGEPEQVRGLAPDFTALKAVAARGVIVTSWSDVPDADFISRFFAPAVGVSEDAVTGSSHCCLSPWWSSRLARERLTGYQASARGGMVRVELRGDRVTLAGQAVTVLHGELVV